jgi:hypothetical protein
MSWARKHFVLDDFGADERKRGYTHKLCPYSTAYRDRYRFIGTVCTGIVNGMPQNISGDFIIGNSTDDSFYMAPYDSYLCSEHTTTSGRMVPKSNPPGWLCEDPNCYYFTTVVSGGHYKEV